MEIKVLKNIMKANDVIAENYRKLLDENKVFCVNIMASPGAGKTSFIIQTIRHLKGKARVGVIEGDVSSTVDSEKVAKEGVPVLQINTGGGCHLDANMMSGAYREMPLEDIDLLFIENVGNLICTVNYDIGEHRKVVVSNVAEGDDKPLKYPAIFNVSHMVIVNKMDLQPYIEYSLDNFVAGVRGINKDVPIQPVSSTTGEGIAKWCEWLLGEMNRDTHQ